MHCTNVFLTFPSCWKCSIKSSACFCDVTPANSRSFGMSSVFSRIKAVSRLDLSRATRRATPVSKEGDDVCDLCLARREFRSGAAPVVRLSGFLSENIRLKFVSRLLSSLRYLCISRRKRSNSSEYSYNTTTHSLNTPQNVKN